MFKGTSQFWLINIRVCKTYTLDHRIDIHHMFINETAHDYCPMMASFCAIRLVTLGLLKNFRSPRSKGSPESILTLISLLSWSSAGHQSHKWEGSSSASPQREHWEESNSLQCIRWRLKRPCPVIYWESLCNSSTLYLVIFFLFLPTSGRIWREILHVGSPFHIVCHLSEIEQWIACLITFSVIGINGEEKDIFLVASESTPTPPLSLLLSFLSWNLGFLRRSPLGPSG